LPAWHRTGMRGLRFHLFSSAGRPGYIRGVGLDVFEAFRPTMRALNWVMQVWCEWRILPDVAATLRDISAEMPVVIDHMLNIPADRGVDDPAFQALLRLVGDGHVHVKLSGAYRLSKQFPDYPDAQPFHAALVRANPERHDEMRPYLRKMLDRFHVEVIIVIMRDDNGVHLREQVQRQRRRMKALRPDTLKR